MVTTLLVKTTRSN